MAPDIAKPEDKNRNDATLHSNGANGAGGGVHLNGGDAGSSDIDRILALEHSDPHTFLGLHRENERMVVRAYRPDADAIAVILDDGSRVPMTRRHDAGIFEASIDRAD